MRQDMREIEMDVNEEKSRCADPNVDDCDQTAMGLPPVTSAVYLIAK
jgi:hypothetical protein